MKDLFVPYEIALALKEIGFDEPCFGRYEFEDKRHPFAITHITKKKIFDVKAPLYDQVIDWFIKKYEIYIIPFIQYEPAYDEKETIINSYMILNLPIMREKELSYLPYIQGNDYMENSDEDTWIGSKNEGILKAIELIKQKK